MSENNRRIAIHFDVDTKELAKLEKAMSTVQNKMNVMSRNIDNVSKQFNSLSRSVESINTSQRKYSNAIDQMNRDTKQAINSVRSLQRTVDRGFNPRGINTSAQSVRTFDNRIIGARESMRGLNRYTLSFSDATAIASERMLQWSIGATMIYGTSRAIREVLYTIVQLDSQLVSLKKVMDADTNFISMMEEMSDSANKFGRKLTEVNDIAIAFAQEGFGEDKISGLVEATSLLSNVGDIDVKKAQSTISSLMLVYDKGITEATGLVDRLNEVTNNYAIDVDNLAVGLQKSTGVAKAFGVSIEENIGNITAITGATRESGAIVGNALKTIYSRITTVGPAMSMLEGVGVKVFDTFKDGSQSVRSVNEILGDLAGKWDNLSASERQNLAVKVAGRYQLTRFLALMDNYQVAIDATKTAQNSWNSAQEENQRYMESLRAKINQVSTSFQEMSKAMGDNGIAYVFAAVLDSANKLMIGITKLFDIFGPFTWILGGLSSGALAVAFNFQRLKTNADLAQASIAQASMRTQQLALTMGMSTTSATTLSIAVGRVTLALKAMALATVANPFFWVAGAIMGITALVGHIEKVKQRQKELNDYTKSANEEYKDFLNAINSGNIDNFQVEKYKKQVEELKNAEKELNELIDNQTEKMKYQTNSYSTLGVSVQSLNKTKKELTASYSEQKKALNEINKEQQNLLAQMGIKINKDTTIKELTEQITVRQNEMNTVIKDAEKAMKEQREKAVLPTAQAYYELGDSIDDQSSAMENALGITDKLMKQMEEQRGIIELLSGIKDKDKVQTQLLENAYAYWADMLGITEEELKKHPELIGKQIDKQKELLELSGKVADGTATAEEKKRAQQLLSAENAEKTAKREANAEKEAQEVQREVLNKKMKKLEEYDKKMEQAMGSASNSVSSSSKVILERMGKQGETVDKTKTKYDDMQEMIKGASAQSSSSVARMSTSTIMNLNGVKKKTDETKSAWERLKEAFSKKITGFASLSIKGIFSGIFGSGGNIDGDKLKEAVMSSGGGSIAGKGFGGLRFTSGFGSRVHPISGKRSFHAGIDLAGPIGTPIRARHGGTVISSGWAGGYGNMVSILGTNGLEYRYAHNSRNYVRPGQFVPAGMTIAAMGSTGDSTGSHLHFEVRRGGQAINPMAYYHNGGIVDKKPKHNEVDARLQVGEMVINQSQQKTLFDFLNKKNANDTYTGMGGPTHTVRYGDTLSEIAMKYFGNAYSGGLEKLLKLNPQIKNKDRIYVGQKINVGSSSSSGSSGSKPKPAPKPKPMYKNADAAQKQLDAGLSWIDQMEHLGIRNSDYRVSNLIQPKYREAYRMTNRGKEYNQMVFDELSQFTDYNKAKQFFDKADLFLSSSDKARTLKNIMKNIGENVLKEIADNTDKWLDNFNKGVKEANQQVQDMIEISNQVSNRKIQEKENNFVSGYVADMLASLGVAPEVDPRDALQQQADDIMDKINQRAEESALLEYRLNSGELQKRLTELSGYRSQLENQMKAIENQFKSRGINDKSLISQAQQPLRDRLAEITAEYEELQNAIKNGNSTLAENKAELEELADQYKKLQDELNKVEGKREFTDIWGNVVRDAEGQVKMISDQGQLLMNTYENIRKEIEGIQQAATGGALSDVISPILAQLKSAVTGFQPEVNAKVTTGAADTSSPSETRTYEANSTVVRNVQYVVQTGVSLASEYELRELAMKMKELIDEENGRG